MPGYAVVDLETTGFSYAKGDRIVEVAVVLLDEAGRVEGTWETLINPLRHVGATHIHHIEPADIVLAPSFDDVADYVGNLLRGRVLVAHNASFDERFLRESLVGAGRFHGDRIPSIDTVSLAKRYAGMSRAKLEDCCAAFGIVNTRAHSALADALVTAELLQIFLKHPRARIDSMWSVVRDESARCDGYECSECAEPAVLSREEARRVRDAMSSGGWFEQGAQNRREPTEADERDYFDLLDAVFLDRHLSVSEQNLLATFVRERGLSGEDLKRLHNSYLRSIVAAACADGVVTEEEEHAIDVVSRTLGIDISSEWLDDQFSQWTEEDLREPGLSVVLSPGDRVTVTGPVLHTNDYWLGFFSAHGVEVAGLSKKTKVLIAGDPDSQSGKAKKARSYGIPIMAESAVGDAIVFGD